ncbi:MAG: hypothetical protein KAH38_05930, partial [Candidatus Hydrogenedentes bacterium]|nr:hypothetical protein [Candidatus Hydrogenedentota bacterium]
NENADLSKMEKASMPEFGGWVMNHFENSRFGLPCACLTTRITGKPYSGNLYLRFDEDLGNKPPRLLYWFSNFYDYPVHAVNHNFCIAPAGRPIMCGRVNPGATKLRLMRLRRPWAITSYPFRPLSDKSCHIVAGYFLVPAEVELR